MKRRLDVSGTVVSGEFSVEPETICISALSRRAVEQAWPSLPGDNGAPISLRFLQ